MHTDADISRNGTFRSPRFPGSPRGISTIDTYLQCVAPSTLRRAVDAVHGVMRRFQQSGRFRMAIRRLAYERTCLRMIVAHLRKRAAARRNFVSRVVAQWTAKEQDLLAAHAAAQAGVRAHKGDKPRGTTWFSNSKRASMDLVMGWDGPPTTAAAEKHRLAELLYSSWLDEWVAKWRQWRVRADLFVSQWASDSANAELLKQGAVARRLTLLKGFTVPEHAPDDTPPKFRSHLGAREIDFLAQTDWREVRREYRDREKDGHRLQSVLRSSGNYRELVRMQQQHADDSSRRLSGDAEADADPHALPALTSPAPAPQEPPTEHRSSRLLSVTQPPRRTSLTPNSGPLPSGKAAVMAPPSLRYFVSREQQRGVLTQGGRTQSRGAAASSQLRDLVASAGDHRYIRDCRTSIVDMQRGARRASQLSTEPPAAADAPRLGGTSLASPGPGLPRPAPLDMEADTVADGGGATPTVWRQQFVFGENDSLPPSPPVSPHTTSPRGRRRSSNAARSPTSTHRERRRTSGSDSVPVLPAASPTGRSPVTAGLSGPRSSLDSQGRRFSPPPAGSLAPRRQSTEPSFQPVEPAPRSSASAELRPTASCAAAALAQERARRTSEARKATPPPAPPPGSVCGAQLGARRRPSSASARRQPGDAAEPLCPQAFAAAAAMESERGGRSRSLASTVTVPGSRGARPHHRSSGPVASAPSTPSAVRNPRTSIGLRPALPSQGSSGGGHTRMRPLSAASGSSGSVTGSRNGPLTPSPPRRFTGGASSSPPPRSPAPRPPAGGRSPVAQ
eukprot:TRINITY_DN30726_c0_g1_i1.p1 TRINITY_DN30726_c0_g1~~TRINITY_DN30726_c0_g1_i1.p1  ORF type:complete len:789 (+),score=154.21 TRINITY_DN30726_c0_g1_i1:57-2423(+)